MFHIKTSLLIEMVNFLTEPLVFQLSCYHLLIHLLEQCDLKIEYAFKDRSNESLK